MTDPGASLAADTTPGADGAPRGVAAPGPEALLPPALAPAAPKPRVWPVFVAFASAAGAQLLAGAAVTIAALLVEAVRQGRPPSAADVTAVASSPAVLLAALGCSALSLAGAAAVGAALSPEPARARLGLWAAGLGPVGLAVAAAGGTAWSLSIGTASRLLHLPRSESGAWLARMVAESGHLVPVAVLVAVALVPVAEELFFRGYVQRRLCRRWGAAWGIAATSAMFGLAHFDRVQSPMAFLLGLYLGWVVHRGRSIVPGVLAHAANNLLWATLVLAGKDTADQAHGPLQVGALLLLYLLATGGAIAWLRRRFARVEAGPGSAIAAAHR